MCAHDGGDVRAAAAPEQQCVCVCVGVYVCVCVCVLGVCVSLCCRSCVGACMRAYKRLYMRASVFSWEQRRRHKVNAGPVYLCGTARRQTGRLIGHQVRSLSLGCARAIRSLSLGDQVALSRLRARLFSVHVRTPPREDACGCLASDGLDMHMHTGAAYACRAQRPSMPKGPSSQPRRGGAYKSTYKPARG